MDLNRQLFMCPEEGCCRVPEITLIDRAKKGYTRQLEIQYGAVPSKPSCIVIRIASPLAIQ